LVDLSELLSAGEMETILVGRLVLLLVALMVEMTVLMTAPGWAVTTVVYSGNWLADYSADDSAQSKVA